MTEMPPAGADGGVRALLRTLVHGNVVIALAATGVALTTVAIAGLPLEPLPMGFVFVATLFAYTLNRLGDRTEDAANLPGRTAFMDAYGRYLVAFAAAGYLCGIVAIAWWRPYLLAGALVPAIAAWLYSSGRVKRVLLGKNLFVGCMWAGIPLGLGVFYGRVADPTILVVAGVIVVLLSSAAAIFDIKDIAGDRATGNRTLPVVVGVERTRHLAMGTVLAVLPVVLVAGVVLSPRLWLLLGYIVYVGTYIPFAHPGRGVLFYGLVVDGEHVLIGAVAGLLWLV